MSSCSKAAQAPHSPAMLRQSRHPAVACPPVRMSQSLCGWATVSRWQHVLSGLPRRGEAIRRGAVAACMAGANRAGRTATRLCRQRPGRPPSPRASATMSAVALSTATPPSPTRRCWSSAARAASSCRASSRSTSTSVRAPGSKGSQRPSLHLFRQVKSVIHHLFSTSLLFPFATKHPFRQA